MPGWIMRCLRGRNLRVVLLFIAFAGWTVYLPNLLTTMSKAKFTFDVGGALGGIAAFGAAVVAWIVAQQQIAKQQLTLDLMSDEHRLRTARVLNRVIHELDRLTGTVVVMQTAIYGHIALLQARGNGHKADLPALHSLRAIFDDADFWRVRFDLQDALHYVEALVTDINKQGSFLSLSEGSNLEKMLNRLAAKHDGLKAGAEAHLRILRRPNDPTWGAA